VVKFDYFLLIIPLVVQTLLYAGGLHFISGVLAYFLQAIIVTYIVENK
jgi:hypothetical protein